MRISDWSSDVCSSDLHVLVRVIAPVQAEQARRTVRGAAHGVDRGEVLLQQLVADDALELRAVPVRHVARDVLQFLRAHVLRSEEHTSELQSLMRISYAVFCLNKKTQKSKHKRHYQYNIRDENVINKQ